MTVVEKIKNLDEKQCVVNVLLDSVKAHPCKDCGKCVFGYEGITQFEMILKDITERKARSEDKVLLTDLANLMVTQAVCDDGKEIAQAMLTALDKQGEVFDEHISKKQCRAGVCKQFMTFHVLASKCNGCTECMEVCEEDAISGKNKFVHVIDNDECTRCGKCIDVCSQGAIVLAGAIKPKCPKKPIPCRKK